MRTSCRFEVASTSGVVMQVRAHVERQDRSMPYSRKRQAPIAPLKDIPPVQQPAGDFHEARVLQPKLFQNRQRRRRILEVPMRDDVLQSVAHELHIGLRRGLAASHEQRKQRRAFGEAIQWHLSYVVNHSSDLTSDLTLGLRGRLGDAEAHGAVQVDESCAAVGFCETHEGEIF